METMNFEISETNEKEYKLVQVDDESVHVFQKSSGTLVGTIYLDDDGFMVFSENDDDHFCDSMNMAVDFLHFCITKP